MLFRSGAVSPQPGIAGVKYDSTIVGLNVLFIDGKPVVVVNDTSTPVLFAGAVDSFSSTVSSSISSTPASSGSSGFGGGGSSGGGFTAFLLGLGGLENGGRLFLAEDVSQIGDVCLEQTFERMETGFDERFGILAFDAGNRGDLGDGARYAFISSFFSGEVAKIDLQSGAKLGSIQTGAPKSVAGLVEYRGEGR